MFITENSGFGSFNITTENQMFWNYTQPVLVINQNWQQSLCIHCPYIQYKKLTKHFFISCSFSSTYQIYHQYLSHGKGNRPSSFSKKGKDWLQVETS